VLIGIHRAIWDQFHKEELDRPPDKPLILSSYDAGAQVAYIESLGVGDPLPEMLLFLRTETYVPAPLEASYMTAWSVFPAALKPLLG